MVDEHEGGVKVALDRRSELAERSAVRDPGGFLLEFQGFFSDVGPGYERSGVVLIVGLNVDMF